MERFGFGRATFLIFQISFLFLLDSMAEELKGNRIFFPNRFPN